MQKSWSDLLGKCGPDCKVDDTFIVRSTGYNRWRVLWAFDTKKQAAMAFAAWEVE